MITPIIVLVACSNLGNAFFPTLVTEHPLALIALAPTNRNFVLVASRVDPVSFYTVGFFRLLAPDPFFFILGRWYGESAISWMERRTPTFGQIMRTLERWFAKARLPLVTAVPNNPVCLLAGAAAMSVALFVVLDIVGTIGRLVLLRIVGDIFATPIAWFVDLVSHYRLPAAGADHHHRGRDLHPRMAGRHERDRAAPRAGGRARDRARPGQARRRR